jgi:anti-sigma B factor antagonist
MSLSESSDPGAELLVSAIDDTSAILSITGEVDVANSPELREALYSLIDQGITNVIVDASGMDFIDSSGLGVLVSALKHIRERSGDLIVRSLQPATTRVFEVTGLMKVFTIPD